MLDKIEDIKMDRDVLQVFAATYVAESDNIKINDKLSLIDFIKELLQTENYIESLIEQGRDGTWKFNVSGPKYLDTISKIETGVTAAIGAAAIITGAHMVYKRFFSKAARACKGKSEGERKTCVYTFKNNAMKAQISALNSGMSKCAKTKNPTKCKLKVQNKIKKLQRKIQIGKYYKDI